jgi:alpha-glucosidase
MRSGHKGFSAVVFGIVFGLTAASAFADAVLSSPDGRIRITVSVKEKLDPYPAGNRVYQSVAFKGTGILLDSPFGIDFKDHPPIAKNLRVVNEVRSSGDDAWETVVGKSRRIRNRYNELRLSLMETDPPLRKIDLIYRATNDGAAFRYFLPEQEPLRAFKLSSERSEFQFADNHTCWAANFGGFLTHQEAEFEKRKIGSLTVSDPIGLPLLVQISDTCFVAITEAGLSDWAGMYVASAGSRPNALVSVLSPRLDEPGVAVVSRTPRFSPWRVLMIGEKPGDLIESNLVLNLSEPSVIGDASWIKPGRCAWDRWWCGSYAPDAGFPIGMDLPSMKYFTDFAAEMGWEYVLVDWYWYGSPFLDNWRPNPDVDITKFVPQMNVPELVRYAAGRNVGVLVWLEWHHADRQMDEAFPLYEKWGVKGVKIDFMARDDQQMVQFYERTLKKAAEHHLTVDFHGAFKPTGLRRTYPNYITQEGVLGNEYNKWSDRVTPGHTVTLAFTRMLAGPMDFTPGGFRNANQSQFKVVGGDAPAPYVMGTRCHQLAMAVVYESPLQVFCDSPYNYRHSPAGLDLLKAVPVTWDETKVLAGQVGNVIVLGRRSGGEWYVGAMTDWDARSVEVPLSFLGAGPYRAQIWQDAPDSNEYPDRLEQKTVTVSASDRMTIRMAGGGGQVIRFSPVK